MLSPKVSSSSSSYSVISLSSLISKGDNLAPQLINIDLAVLPAACLYFLYCLTAKWPSSLLSKSSNIISIGFLNSSLSSLASIWFNKYSKVLKFLSSLGNS